MSQCINGNPHEYSSKVQKISYNNSSPKGPDTISFEDANLNVSGPLFLTKTYTCLVCDKTICETYEFVRSEVQKTAYFPADHEIFLDFWQVMSERNAVFDVLMEIGVSANEAVIGTPDENTDMEKCNIPPLEVNEQTERKIIESRGGIRAMMEFMAYNAGWENYRDLLSCEDDEEEEYD